MRRTFLKKLADTTGVLSLSPFMTKVLAEDIKEALLHLNQLSPPEAAQNEDLWYRIRQAYTVSPNIINLNSGGVSPQPKVVQDVRITPHVYTSNSHFGYSS